MRVYGSLNYTYIKPKHNWNNLISGLKLRVQENILMHTHRWQFNTAQNPEITGKVQGSPTPHQESRQGQVDKAARGNPHTTEATTHNE